MSTDYPYTRAKVEGAWNLSPANLNPPVKAALRNKEYVARFTDVDVMLSFTDALTAPEVSTLNQVVADAKAAFDPLPGAKARKVQEIRANTKTFLAQGLQSGGLIYASTDEGRFDIMAIFTVGVVAATPGFFPKKVTTTDGTTETEFANAGAFTPFFTDIRAGYDYWKSSSQVLRQQANDATTVPEVDAVVDDRTWPWSPP